jgi:4-amino-4-deoxy-L-arabinose transferase-like glycosyltransferase
MKVAAIGRTMRVRSYSNLWYGLIAFSASLLGIVLLANERARPLAVLLLIGTAVLAVIIWRRQEWIPAFPPYPIARIPNLDRSRFFCLSGVVSAFLLALAADLRCLAAPNETFGLAGILWLAGIGMLLSSTFVWPHSAADPVGELHLTRWPTWEIVLLAGLVLVALLARVWDLSSVPDNIYPDEIMTGAIAAQSYINQTGSGPSVFSTVWNGIDLPALWFWIVSLFLKVGGSTLAMLRLPAALFGAATVVPLYGLIRGTWGRYAAMAGTAILAFSASNIHYSRLALNNITTQFFWATCFFFLWRGLRSRRPFDWALAGLSAGLSEYFYYGTRLLPFILLVFICFVLAFHWPQSRQYVSYFWLLAGSYLLGFGPLLFHFMQNPNLYFGRGASLMIWSPHIPTTFEDFQSTWKTVWPVISENLLGISTHSSQDIIFYAPLLLPAEAALLVLGISLLLWHWRHPVAFLMLTAGLGVFLIGGALVASPNSIPPLINHWTPAFPAFYVALAVFIGAWVASAQAALPVRLRWILPAALAIGLSLLGWLNVDFYFHCYYADPASLKSSAYRLAQQNYEIQTAQSRYQALLGPGYHVFTVGRQGSPPYDPITTRYLVANQEWTMLTNPAAELPSLNAGNRGLAFLFFPGTERYRELTHKLYPGGADGEVTTKPGKHLFYVYVLKPAQSQAIHK